MSDKPQKCYEMVRLTNIEKIMGKVQEDMILVREKIFDGFSDSIQSTEEKVNYIDKRNREEHNKLSSKLDKIIFMWIGGAISIIVGVIVGVVIAFVRGHI